MWGLPILIDPDMPTGEIRFVYPPNRMMGRIVNIEAPQDVSDPPVTEPVCEKCGTVLDIGMWPFCPHERGANAVVPDDVPGGFVVENGFAQPTRFDSKSAHRQALADRGLEMAVRHAGPDDKICPRWDTVDLDAAKALLERGPQAIREKRDRWPRATEPITVTLAGTIRQKDL